MHSLQTQRMWRLSLTRHLFGIHAELKRLFRTAEECRSPICTRAGYQRRIGLGVLQCDERVSSPLMHPVRSGDGSFYRVVMAALALRNGVLQLMVVPNCMCMGESAGALQRSIGVQRSPIATSLNDRKPT